MKLFKRKSADQLLAELGYIHLEEDDDVIRYEKQINLGIFSNYFDFSKGSKTICAYTINENGRYLAKNIHSREVRAIAKKLKELGWM